MAHRKTSPSLYIRTESTPSTPRPDYIHRIHKPRLHPSDCERYAHCVYRQMRGIMSPYTLKSKKPDACTPVEGDHHEIRKDFGNSNDDVSADSGYMRLFPIAFHHRRWSRQRQESTDNLRIYRIPNHQSGERRSNRPIRSFRPGQGVSTADTAANIRKRRNVPKRL